MLFHDIGLVWRPVIFFEARGISIPKIHRLPLHLSQRHPDRDFPVRFHTTRTVVFLFLLFVHGLGQSPPVWADEVHLANGDKLSGTIVKLEEGSLTLNTTYAGDIKLAWKEVIGLTSQEPLTIEIGEGAQFRGTVELAEPGMVQILDPETGSTRPVSVASIQVINPPPDFRYKGTTSLGGNQLSGNTDTAALNFLTLWDFSLRQHRLVLGGKYNYAEAKGAVTARNARAHLGYDYFFYKKTFLDLDQLFEQDTFQSLALRSTTSVGIGYQVFDTTLHKLEGSGGVGYVFQDFKTEPRTQDPTARWSIRWEWSAVPDKLVVFHRQQGFRDFGSDSSAFRLNADQGVRITIYKKLYVNFEFDFRFNSEPAPGRQKTDEAIIYGLGWEVGN